METRQEQAHYGDRCTPHGVAIGTPGGYDILCGLCEAGLFDWIESPRYALTLEGRPFANIEWGDNAPSIARACEAIAKVFAVVTLDIGEWAATETAPGYWA